MLPKSLDGLLIRTIMQARYESVFRVLAAVQAGDAFPVPFDEHAPATSFSFDGGIHELKGQAFLPSIIYQDAQGGIVRPERTEPMSEAYYFDRITRALTQDNMTVQLKTDVISGLRIPNERFERFGMMIVEGKRNAHRQIERLPEHYPAKFVTDDIVKSYLPPVPMPKGGVGTKTTLTSMLAVGMWKMYSFVDLYLRDLHMAPNDDPRFDEFYALMRSSQDPIVSAEGTLLANPNIVVAHASPYFPDSITGLTRILGFRGTKTFQSRLGEFECVSFERATSRAMRSLPNHTEVPEEAAWAYHVSRTGALVPIIAVHREYGPARPGKRPMKNSYRLLEPREFGFDPEALAHATADKLSLSYVAPVSR